MPRHGAVIDGFASVAADIANKPKTTFQEVAMKSGNGIEHCLLLRVGVVARGSRCLSIVRLLEAVKPTRLRLKLVGLVPTTKSIACLKFAGEAGIRICEDYMELLSMEPLDLIMEMTGDAHILMDLVRRKPASMGVLDLQTSMLLFDIAQQYEMVARKETEISLATSFASAMLEASPDSVMVIDQDFRIINCNSFPLIKGGKGRKATIGKYCFEALHGTLSPVLLIVSSLLNSAYYFPIIVAAFFAKAPDDESAEGEVVTTPDSGHGGMRVKWQEAPLTMLIPIMILAVGCIAFVLMPQNWPLEMVKVAVSELFIRF